MAPLLQNHVKNVIKTLLANSLRRLSHTKVAKNDTLGLQNNVSCNAVYPSYLELCENWGSENEALANSLIKTMTIHENFLTEQEEENILTEIEPYLKRLHYEKDHWDDAIHGYRETERLKWKTINQGTINRVRDLAFPKGVAQLKHVHILDLTKDGYIKPHIDAVRFCGNTIAGLCLLSDCVMRLVHDKHKLLWANVLLKRRSLYIMQDDSRYDYTHEVLPNNTSIFKGKPVLKDRRISVICRNEPNSNDA